MPRIRSIAPKFGTTKGSAKSNTKVLEKSEKEVVLYILSSEAEKEITDLNILSSEAEQEEILHDISEKVDTTLGEMETVVVKEVRHHHCEKLKSNHILPDNTHLSSVLIKHCDKSGNIITVESITSAVNLLTSVNHKHFTTKMLKIQQEKIDTRTRENRKIATKNLQLDTYHWIKITYFLLLLLYFYSKLTRRPAAIKLLLLYCLTEPAVMDTS